MSTYSATVKWQRREDEAYLDNQYCRGHEWIFDGGVTVPASSSPSVVPVPMSVEANVDPEEAFIAALSSCHMLFFLAIAAKKKFVVDAYVDEAFGVIEKTAEGKMAMTRVTLQPRAIFSGDKQPAQEELDRIHHLAHKNCFIANSVKSEVVVAPRV